MRRSDPDARGNTTDDEYIYMRNPSDRGLELTNDDSWWWLKRNSERVFNDAKTAQSRNTEVTLMWNRWRSTLFTWYPNVIAIGPAGSWPLWSVRTIIFYGLSVVLWLSYFYAFFRLRRSMRRCMIANPIVGRLLARNGGDLLSNPMFGQWPDPLRTSDSDDLEQELQQNLKPRRETQQAPRGFLVSDCLKQSGNR